MNDDEVSIFPKTRPVETDPRFLSGPWTGFWLQRSYDGRQWMRELWLRFSEGRIEGGGRDCVGPFVFVGQYDVNTGRCALHKQYLNAHSVDYGGHNDDDGLWVWGVWRIRQDSGGFHLWPRAAPDPTLRRERAARKRPVSQSAGILQLLPAVDCARPECASRRKMSSRAAGTPADPCHQTRGTSAWSGVRRDDAAISSCSAE